MFLTVSLTVLLCFLDPVSTQSDIHKKVGDDVILTPGTASITAPITSIMWRVGQHIAVQWDDSETDVVYYRHFKERGNLNISSGAMTIRGVTQGDSELYTPEINGNLATPTRLIVISPVPLPIVSVSCVEEKTSCVLTCEGNTTGAEPITYTWKLDGSKVTTSSREHYIEKEKSLNIKEFSCELVNPVSWQSSEPILNPFNPDTTSERNLNFIGGLVVFISLLSAVLVLALVHRWRAGMWFFEKASMPWEADFWKRNERAPAAEVVDSNGTTALQEQGQGEGNRNGVDSRCLKMGTREKLLPESTLQISQRQKNFRQ